MKQQKRGKKQPAKDIGKQEAKAMLAIGYKVLRVKPSKLEQEILRDILG